MEKCKRNSFGYISHNISRRYWEDHEVRPFMLIDKPNKVLPSDCQFREDLIWRKMNDFDKGQVRTY